MRDEMSENEALSECSYVRRCASCRHCASAVIGAYEMANEGSKPVRRYILCLKSSNNKAIDFQGSIVVSEIVFSIDIDRITIW
jgi:hypothetical protein